MKRKYLSLIILAVLALGLASTVSLNPGDSALVTCVNPVAITAQPNSVNVVCPVNTSTGTPVPATATRTATSPVPTATTAADLGGAWHAPDGNHEHGDAFPSWVQSSAYPASFNFPGNTPNENLISYKHSGFKGYAGPMNGVNIYAIIHNDVTPAGQSSRFHSFQFWMQDSAGGVSYIDGWMDFGPDNVTQTGPNIFRFGCGEDANLRPVIQVNVQLCPSGSAPTQGLAFETWYSHPGGHLGQAGWMPDFGFSTSATYYNFGDPTNPGTWVPTGNLNLNRRIELSWYANRDNHRGLFYSTQFGKVVSGPNDPLCGTQYVVGTRSYTVVCLKEFIAPTAQTIQFPGNNFQKSYPGPVHLPN